MEFRILGPLEIEADGRLLRVAGAKQRSLLALLLLHANEVMPRDRLIDELWGAGPPWTAGTALQVHVSQLRKVLGPDVIVTQRPGYLIRVAEKELDLQRFELAVGDARSAAPAEAAALLEAALALWRGAPFAELDTPSLRAERVRLEEQRLAALEDRIDADLDLGRDVQLLPELDRLVHEQPLRERLRGQLMLALYRAGRQADALAAYQEGRRLLVDELGLEPDEPLQRLERAILNHDPALAPAADVVPTGAGKPIRLVLAEDHYLLREGMRRLLESQPELEVVAVCEDLDSLLSAVARERPDVVVTDIRMPPGNLDEGIRAAEHLRTSAPDVGVVVLSQYLEPRYALALFEGGTERRAYLLKERVKDVAQLAAAVVAVAAGGSAIDPKVVESLVAAKGRREHSPLRELTPRERDVLREMAEGKTNASIAASLVLTEGSVEKVVHSIFRKLGLGWETSVHKRVKAVILYLAESEAKGGTVAVTPSPPVDTVS